MTEELDVQPELHLPTNATGSTHMFTRAKLQDHFAAWQGNIQAAVWHYYDDAFDAYVRLLLEHPDFSVQQKLGFIKGCQQLYLNLQGSLAQHLAAFGQAASQGPLRVPPEPQQPPEQEQQGASAEELAQEPELDRQLQLSRKGILQAQDSVVQLGPAIAALDQELRLAGQADALFAAAEGVMGKENIAQDFASLAGQAHQLQDLLQQADRLRQQQLSMGGPGKGLSDQQVAVMAEKAIMQRKAGAGGVPVEVLQSINEQLAA